MLVLRILFLEVVSELIICRAGFTIQIDLIVICVILFGLFIGVLGIILGISCTQILELLKRLLFFAIGTLVELVGRAAIVGVPSKHLSNFFIFSRRIIVRFKARTAIVDDQDAL